MDASDVSAHLAKNRERVAEEVAAARVRERCLLALPLAPPNPEKNA